MLIGTIHVCNRKRQFPASRPACIMSICGDARQLIAKPSDLIAISRQAMKLILAVIQPTRLNAVR
ncbi:MAG TPA: hypothetical protein VIK18_18150, partial [Pirellulales bacterium]